MKRDRALFEGHGDVLHLLELLDAALRLRSFRRLGAKAIDELLQVRLLRILLGLHADSERHPLGFLLQISVVAANEDFELFIVERQNVRHRTIEHFAIVADADHRVRIVAQILFEPGSAFEIEIVGRLIEDQQIGRGKEHAGQGRAHAPAAGELARRAMQIFLLETQADHDRAGAGFAGIAVDLSEPHVNVGDALRIFGGLCFFQQRRHLLVRRHHQVEQRRIHLRRFLRDETHARAPAYADR